MMDWYEAAALDTEYTDHTPDVTPAEEAPRLVYDPATDTYTGTRRDGTPVRVAATLLDAARRAGEYDRRPYAAVLDEVLDPDWWTDRDPARFRLPFDLDWDDVGGALV